MKNRNQHVIAFLLLLFSLNASAQIPIYNSFPSARATVFLDFDGQYVNGTSWNYNGPFTCGPAGLTTAQITEIFNRVSEDYRPFNVNITTDSTVYWSAPVYQRQRIILTVTSSWYGTPVGGISYIGSFTWGDNTPSFVFTQLLNFNTKYIAEATAHEIGHTLGLKHQSAYDANCNKTNEYNYGSGSGEIGWAPVMGCGYYQNFTLWHNGADPYGCNQYQDDLGIITLSNGFGYRPDDYSGNVDNTATQASFVNNQFTMNGVIEQINDKDVFQFTVPSAGRFHLDATPFSVSAGDVGSNLDIQLELIDNTATVIGTYNPATLLSASIDTALNPEIITYGFPAQVMCMHLIMQAWVLIH